MKKLFFIMLVLLFSFKISAYNKSGLTNEQEHELLSEGLPIPGSGVTILPRAKLKLTEKSIRAIHLCDEQKEKYGYIKKYNSRAKELLELKFTTPHHYKKYENDNNPYSTNMKHSILDIPMAYEFTVVPENEIKNLIGFAPMGTYLKDQGWTGAGEFFDTDFGSCAFSESNLILTNGAAILPKEDVTNEINNKTTLFEVIGSDNSGYVYEVEWYDSSFRRKLECATRRYSKNIARSIINLAKIIDKS